MLLSQINAYRDIHKESLSGRDLEAEVLSCAAAKLQACYNNFDPQGSVEVLFDALKNNQKLWTILQTEIANPGNPLPKELKQDLLNLSIFIDKRTFDLMINPNKERLEILIKININLAAGLRNK